MKNLVLALFAVVLLSSCSLFENDPEYEYQIEAEFQSFSDGVNSNHIYGLFEEIETSNDFLVQFQGGQDTLFTRGWRGQLGLNKEEDYYILEEIID